MNKKNKNNTLQLFKLLSENELEKNILLEKLNIKQATFYKHLNIIKKAGFEVEQKKGKYKIVFYKKEHDFTSCEQSVIAYLSIVSKKIFSKSKKKELDKSFEKILLLSNKEQRKITEEKYKTYEQYFSKNNYDFTNSSRENILENIKPKRKKRRKKAVEEETLFELYGKLAKTYHLKEDERIIDCTKEKLVIASSNTDKENLYKRLLRYDILCKVVFPKKHVKDFKNIIEKSLANLEEFQDNIF